MNEETLQKPAILKMHEDHIDEVGFSSRVTGSTFYPHAQEILRLLKKVPPKNIILRFEREPDNEFDPNAVAIYVSIKNAHNEYKIGHFPKEGAPLISYVLLHNKEYQIVIRSISLSGGDEQRDLVGMFFDFNNNKL